MEWCGQCFVFLCLAATIHATVIPQPAPNVCNNAMATQVKRLEKLITNAEEEKEKLQAEVQTLKDAAAKEAEQCTVDLAESQTSLLKCESRTALIPASCDEWKKAGYQTDGNYVIDPDGPAAVPQFTVECLMNGYNGHTVTAMHHDSEARLSAGKCETVRSCIRNVKYSATMEQIKSVIDASKECKQFLSYSCFHSLINFNKTHSQAWYSRDGALMYYWAGATPGSQKCACGMLNSCDKPGRACNCDVNDFVWRSDSGYLTDKSTLPVSKMAFGDLGHSKEQGYHRLGALHCFGNP